MKIELVQDSYGKSAVRLGKITRHADNHEFKEIHVNIQFEGDFGIVYTEGINKNVLPTDTMKNTIFALAKEHPLTTIEDFGLYLTEYFLSHNPQITAVTVDLVQVSWERMENELMSEPYTYIGGGNEQQTAKIRRTHESIDVESGIRGVRILKTAHSGFADYLFDKFTTLPPSTDRIMATELESSWQYHNIEIIDFQKIRIKVRNHLLKSFADHLSRSVQHTLYAMGETVLENVEEVIEIALKMPNLHYLLVNMKPFEMDNKNEVFLASGDAFGYITGTLRRT